VKWAITKGNGNLINKGNNSIQLALPDTGKVSVTATIGNVTATSTVKVVDPTSIKSGLNNDEMKVYPNPVNKIASFNITTSKPCNVNIKIYDIAGRLCLSDIKKVYNPGKQVIELNTTKLLKGAYTFEIESADGHYNGKLVKE
jgi:hypothetical protein